MPYSGQTYRVPATGGWNANPNYDLVDPSMMVDVNNINIDSGGRKPRGGNVRQNATAITDEPMVTGIFHYLKEGGINYVVDQSGNFVVDEFGNYLVTGADDILCGCDNGTIYKNYTTQLKSGLNNAMYYWFETFYDKIYVCNDGANWPQVWDGVQSYTWDFGTPKACTAALAGLGAGNVNSGVHYYKITFVSASGESSGGATSNSVTTTAGNGQVALSSIPLGIDGTTARKIYRTEAGGTSYKLLATLSDNTTTTYADNIADGSLTDAIPTTNLAFAPSDWANSKPKYMIQHGHGINKRLCAIGVAEYPNALYMSAAGSDDMSDANVVKINFVGSGMGLVGMIESAGNLMLFSAGFCFILNDTDSDTANWYYSRAIWTGGVGHQRLLVKTPSDLMAMDEFREVYSVMASESYGDYKIASIARPAFIHKWIDDNVDMTKIERFHAIYDPMLRAIKIWVVTNGNEYPTVALVYFIDYGWSKHTYTNAQICSALVRVSQSNYGVFTGSDNGFVRRTEESTLLDDGVAYTTDHTLPPLTFENARSYKRYDRLWVLYKPRGTETLDIDTTIDGTAIPQQTFTSVALSDTIEEYPLYIGVVGQRIKSKISNDLGENYYISGFLYDVEELGSHGK